MTIELRYFKPKEFVMGDEIVYNHMQEEFLKQLDEVRHRLKRSMRITSSYRTKEYNDKVGGAPRSTHVMGRAVDIYIKHYTGKERIKLVSILKDMNLTAGIAKSFIHIDNRLQPTLFGYGGK